MKNINFFFYGMLVAIALALMFSAGATFAGMAIAFVVGVVLRMMDNDCATAIMLVIVISLMLTMGLTS